MHNNNRVAYANSSAACYTTNVLGHSLYAACVTSTVMHWAVAMLLCCPLCLVHSPLAECPTDLLQHEPIGPLQRTPPVGRCDEQCGLFNCDGLTLCQHTHTNLNTCPTLSLPLCGAQQCTTKSCAAQRITAMQTVTHLAHSALPTQHCTRRSCAAMHDPVCLWAMQCCDALHVWCSPF
jgi:hypothetical protein